MFSHSVKWYSDCLPPLCQLCQCGVPPSWAWFAHIYKGHQRWWASDHSLYSASCLAHVCESQNWLKLVQWN